MTIGAESSSAAVLEADDGVPPLKTKTGTSVMTDSSRPSTPTDSPNLSATSSAATQDHDHKQQPTGAAAAATTITNTDPPPTKSRSMSRLQRMFSNSARHGNSVAAATAARNGVNTPSPTLTPKEEAEQTPTSATATTHPPQHHHQQQQQTPAHHPPTETPHHSDEKPRVVSAEQQPLHTRFEILPDGSHEHHLRAAKRQEKLRNMLERMIGTKKKDIAPDGSAQTSGAVTPQHHHAEGGGGGGTTTTTGPAHLSLVQNWMDELKNDRSNILAGTLSKGGPNSTATLVEKYGKCQEIIGRGAFGIVRISHKANAGGEILYAVKEFRKRPQESSKKYTKRLTSEFCISSSLRHNNIIHTLDLLQDSKGDYCEVMEYCAGGDLYTLILAAGKLEVAEADCFFKQLMRGVQYMHEMGVAHRDLKPENLLLTPYGALKITDFGNGECFRMAWEKEAHLTCGLCGSAPYIAPEEYTDKEFDPRAVDVWATGVIYMAMRTGRHLWRIARRDEDEFYQRYLEGRKDEGGYEPIETLPRSRCRNVIYSILDPNPSRRITSKQVLNSEWGREIKVCKPGDV